MKGIVLADDKGYEVLAVENKGKHSTKGLLKNIFSVKNENIHKIVTILGIKLTIDWYLNNQDWMKSIEDKKASLV